MVRGFWSDPDRRRAGMLSLLVHGLLLIAMVLWIDLDLGDPEPQEQFLVIDLGTPMVAEEATPAPAADAPAPDAPTPAVEADAPGAPTPGTPEPDAVTAGDPDVPTEPEATDPAPEAPPPDEAVEPDPSPPEVATGPVEVPTPAVRTPEAPLPTPAPDVTAAIPEIESPELEPRPLADALPMPVPSTTPSGGAVAVADVTPEVQAEARALTPPPARVEGPTASGLPAPTPTVDAAAAPRPLAAPEAAADAPDGRELDVPAVRTEAATARALGTDPSVAGVRAARSLATPAVRAEVRTAVPADEALAPGAAANVPNDPDALAGGDAPRPGQPGDLPDAEAGALGQAASPDGDPDAEVGGAPAVAPPPFRETRPRPLAVVVDNAPQGYARLTGVASASWIAEMPVEGGLTRLMPVFDVADPGRVGPVRSLRDYFVHLAERTDAVLVHDGGSPDAMVALSGATRPSLNAFQRGDLFSRASDGAAPYNLFSDGGSLRGAIGGLNVSPQRLVAGYRPFASQEEDAVERAGEVDIVWSGAYRSSFTYLEAQDRYRWYRNGEAGVQADGQAILVDAVLIARVDARPKPGDTEGRLFIPVDQGGPATLLWRGTVQYGRWNADGGLTFTTEDGTDVSLEALRTWAAFVPNGRTIELR